jgi:hypothetical protein
MGKDDERRKLRRSYALVVLAIPAAWAVTTLLRATVLAARVRTTTASFGPSLRRIAWVSFGLTVLLGAVSAWLRPALRRRYEPGAAMMTGASVPQVPAILSVSIGMLGADTLPVALAVLASTVLVAWHRPAEPD